MMKATMRCAPWRTAGGSRVWLASIASLSLAIAILWPRHSTASLGGMQRLEGGSFRMGDRRADEAEQPIHEATVTSFWIDRTEVTVQAFEGFVRETGYRTDAERAGWSGVFDVDAGLWRRIAGATWRRPEGPHGDSPLNTEPVTQVSWDDSGRYARWAGKRLPTEAEWEFAARGGRAGQVFPWGDEHSPGGAPQSNWWQGAFPTRNTLQDGFLRRAPVAHYTANGYGLFDVSGNVWEWTADVYAQADEGASGATERTLRGGSWLCSIDRCMRFRTASRSHATPDSSLNNVGFRCVRSMPPPAAAQP